MGGAKLTVAVENGDFSGDPFAGHAGKMCPTHCFVTQLDLEYACRVISSLGKFNKHSFRVCCLGCSIGMPVICFGKVW